MIETGKIKLVGGPKDGKTLILYPLEKTPPPYVQFPCEETYAGYKYEDGEYHFKPKGVGS